MGGVQPLFLESLFLRQKTVCYDKNLLYMRVIIPQLYNDTEFDHSSGHVIPQVPAVGYPNRIIIKPCKRVENHKIKSRVKF